MQNHLHCKAKFFFQDRQYTNVKIIGKSNLMRFDISFFLRKRYIVGVSYIRIYIYIYSDVGNSYYIYIGV